MQDPLGIFATHPVVPSNLHSTFVVLSTQTVRTSSGSAPAKSFDAEVTTKMDRRGVNKPTGWVPIAYRAVALLFYYYSPGVAIDV
jgi:hypothetical protein